MVGEGSHAAAWDAIHRMSALANELGVTNDERSNGTKYSEAGASSRASSSKINDTNQRTRVRARIETLQNFLEEQRTTIEEPLPETPDMPTPTPDQPLRWLAGFTVSGTPSPKPPSPTKKSRKSPNDRRFRTEGLAGIPDFETMHRIEVLDEMKAVLDRLSPKGRGGKASPGSKG